MQAEYVGGRVLVDPAGLTVPLRPAGNRGNWKEKFNANSFIPGQSEGSNVVPGLIEVTAEAGGSS